MKKPLFFLLVALFCSLRTFAQQAPIIKINGSATNYAEFKSAPGITICINIEAEVRDTSSKDTTILSWNLGIPKGNFIHTNSDSALIQNDEGQFCLSTNDKDASCTKYYFTVYAAYKNNPSAPKSQAVIGINIYPRVGMKSEIKSLGNGNYEFIAVPFSISGQFCLPEDSLASPIQWDISKNGNGVFSPTSTIRVNNRIAQHQFTQNGKYVVRCRLESRGSKVAAGHSFFTFDTVHVNNFSTSVMVLENHNMFFYPNPVKNLLHLQTTAEVQHLEMYDVIGRKIHINYTPNGDEYHIELPDLSKGVYFIHLITAQQQRFSQKVCIE
jgi:hypothetical protein